MSMFEYNLKVAFIDIKIQSNLDISKFINSPEPYGLCINYYIRDIESKEDAYKIIIDNKKSMPNKAHLNILFILKSFLKKI